jgi:uncharacterized protein
MEFENAFSVKAPVEEVWTTLLDVERVAPCMPGAQVLERTDDDTYKVGIRVKVGPMSMLYRGEVEIVERDAAQHRATMRAKAKEARGQGTADATIHMALADQGAATQATIDTQVQLSGKAAAMGQGVIQDVSAKLVETFAQNLQAMLESRAPEANGGAETAPAPAAPPPAATPPPPEEASLPVGKIVAGVLAGRLRNPRTLGAATLVLAIVFLAIRVRRRRAA